MQLVLTFTGPIRRCCELPRHQVFPLRQAEWYPRDQDRPGWIRYSSFHGRLDFDYKVSGLG